MAQAAFELALETSDLEGWQKALEKMAQLARDEEVIHLLENPKVSFEAKKRLLEDRLGEIPALAMNLALLLVHKDRLRGVGDVERQFQLAVEASRGIEHAEVTTAVPLTDPDKDLISRRLGEMIGKKVVLESQVDPSVIGGLVARMGDLLIDGSIHRNLETLRKTLVEGRRG
jgi:F-type H+-transporting ATPase subunit delta